MSATLPTAPGKPASAKIQRASAEVLSELSRIGLLEQFSEAGVITPVSLNLTPIFAGRDLAAQETLDLYESLGVFFGRVHRSAKWWIGEWILWGEGAFGERYAQVADATGLSVPYLQNIAYVTRSIPPSRRLDGVSFSLHAEVAPLPPTEQTVWLKRAVEHEMSSRDLRRAISNEKSGNAPEKLFEPDSDEHDSKPPILVTRVVEVARMLYRQGRRQGDHVEVPIEAWEQLTAALGEER